MVKNVSVEMDFLEIQGEFAKFSQDVPKTQCFLQKKNDASVIVATLRTDSVDVFETSKLIVKLTKS